MQILLYLGRAAAALSLQRYDVEISKMQLQQSYQCHVSSLATLTAAVQQGLQLHCNFNTLQSALYDAVLEILDAGTYGFLKEFALQCSSKRPFLNANLLLKVLHSDIGRVGKLLQLSRAGAPDTSFLHETLQELQYAMRLPVHSTADAGCSIAQERKALAAFLRESNLISVLYSLTHLTVTPQPRCIADAANFNIVARICQVLSSRNVSPTVYRTSNLVAATALHCFAFARSVKTQSLPLPVSAFSTQCAQFPVHDADKVIAYSAFRPQSNALDYPLEHRHGRLLSALFLLIAATHYRELEFESLELLPLYETVAFARLRFFSSEPQPLVAFLRSQQLPDELLLLIRGTLNEWALNFESTLVPLAVSAPHLGNVHFGYKLVADTLLPATLEQADRDGVRSVLLAGHSLGAAVAHILGVLLKLRRPALSVEVVAFGSPKFADDAFANLMRQSISVTNWLSAHDSVNEYPCSPKTHTATGLFGALSSNNNYAPLVNPLYITATETAAAQFPPAESHFYMVDMQSWTREHLCVYVCFFEQMFCDAQKHSLCQLCSLTVFL